MLSQNSVPENWLRTKPLLLSEGIWILIDWLCPVEDQITGREPRPANPPGSSLRHRGGKAALQPPGQLIGL